MHFHGVKSEKVQSEPTLGSHRYYDLHHIPQVWPIDAQFPHNQPQRLTEKAIPRVSVFAILSVKRMRLFAIT
jgi:hypothetical protein